MKLNGKGKRAKFNINCYIKTLIYVFHFQDYFADLKIFFRKWLSESFVETLSANGTSLVWDYLFLNNFSSSAAVNVCVAIVHLLKPYLNAADTFTQVTV